MLHCHSEENDLKHNSNTTRTQVRGACQRIRARRCLIEVVRRGGRMSGDVPAKVAVVLSYSILTLNRCLATLGRMDYTMTHTWRQAVPTRLFRCCPFLPSLSSCLPPRLQQLSIPLSSSSSPLRHGPSRCTTSREMSSVHEPPPHSRLKDASIVASVVGTSFLNVCTEYEIPLCCLLIPKHPAVLLLRRFDEQFALYRPRPPLHRCSTPVSFNIQQNRWPTQC